MRTLLYIIQVILALLLVGSILLQNQGSGLGIAFGAEGNFYRTKRGVEKYLFTFTIILSILFLATAVVNFLV